MIVFEGIGVAAGTLWQTIIQVEKGLIAYKNTNYYVHSQYEIICSTTNTLEKTNHWIDKWA